MNKPPPFSPQAAWQTFIAGAPLLPGSISPDILDSWQRCQQAGVDPFSGSQTKMLPAEGVRTLQKKRQELMGIAQHFMEKLYQFVANSGFVVLLSDEQGYLLVTIGDEEVLAKEQRLNLELGALWVEEEVGNNGIGTALALGKPVQISGCEHFCRKHHSLTCSGAPISNGQGTIIGVLEMSGPVEKTHLHTLGMVVAAVEAIEQQLRVQRRNREMSLLNNQLNNIFRTVSDGVLVVDLQGSIKQANPSAETILGHTQQVLAHQPVQQYLDHWQMIRKGFALGRAQKDQELVVHSSKGPIHCLMAANPIKDNSGNVIGGVVFLNPLNQLKTLVNRFSGSHATFTFAHIVGNSPCFRKAIDLCRLVAKRESIVLLRGESGTGKEMAAQAIHNQSRRCKGPFVAVNCGAIPRELIASELFGYVEGAFTGARKKGRPGKFELANGGTLFLDEIGDMPLEQQVALLRVLQEKTVSRIGSNQMVQVDTRIICATHKDLPQEVGRGNFRQDLYYRLNVISIHLPALREHLEDIPLMFDVFLEKACRKLGIQAMEVSPEVIGQLQQYDWPGNVRELQNIIERMVNLADEGEQSLGIRHLPREIIRQVPAPSPSAASTGFSFSKERQRIKQLLMEQEREQTLALLYENKGNMSKTAQMLGMSRSTLYRKLASWQQRG